MSSWDIGDVKAVIDHEIRTLTVGNGRGWGGDGKRMNYSYMEYYDDKGELHMILLTNNYLRKLLDDLETAYNCAECMLEEDLAQEEAQSNTDVELEPCPFCGHDVSPPYHDDLGTDDDYCIIKCPYCGVMMYEQDEKFLIENWNSRM